MPYFLPDSLALNWCLSLLVPVLVLIYILFLAPEPSPVLSAPPPYSILSSSSWPGTPFPGLVAPARALSSWSLSHYVSYWFLTSVPLSMPGASLPFRLPLDSPSSEHGSF